jgi:hypothetical protein
MAALDEILGMSHAFRQGDEMKHLSGASQSQRADKQFVILQYSKENPARDDNYVC